MIYTLGSCYREVSITARVILMPLVRIELCFFASKYINSFQMAISMEGMVVEVRVMKPELLG